MDNTWKHFRHAHWVGDAPSAPSLDLRLQIVSLEANGVESVLENLDTAIHIKTVENMLEQTEGRMK